MGIAVRNIEQEITSGVAGDGTNKTITHSMNSIPTWVHLTARSFGADPVLVSVSQTNVIVKGALGTFDVMIVR